LEHQLHLRLAVRNHKHNNLADLALHSHSHSPLELASLSSVQHLLQASGHLHQASGHPLQALGDLGHPLLRLARCLRRLNLVLLNHLEDLAVLNPNNRLEFPVRLHLGQHQQHQPRLAAKTVPLVVETPLELHGLALVPQLKPRRRHLECRSRLHLGLHLCPLALVSQPLNRLVQQTISVLLLPRHSLSLLNNRSVS
jgi:hypothetical protein